MFQLIPNTARPYKNIYVVDVTPELARTWLSINNFNRPRNSETVAKYVRQIQEGRWRLTHQGIAFTEDGVLLDGQHRLFAILQCGQTVPMLVCLNESPENFGVIDCGRNRSNLDIVRMSLKDGTISSLHTSTLKSMLAGRFCKTANRWSNDELSGLYRKHVHAVDFVAKMFRNCKDKQINDPTVRGVIARAYYHSSQEQLELFCSQMIQGGEHPCRAVIDIFVSYLRYWEDRRENTKREIYKRCELTLEAFLRNSGDVSYSKDIYELFPLPNEER